MIYYGRPTVVSVRNTATALVRTNLQVICLKGVADDEDIELERVVRYSVGQLRRLALATQMARPKKLRCRYASPA